jgi:hypothetical protein
LGREISPAQKGKNNLNNKHNTSEVQTNQIGTVCREVVESAPLPRGFYRGPRLHHHFLIWNDDEAWARRVSKVAKR